MARDIVHLAVPAFAVSLARVVDASLRERPVAVSSGPSSRALLQCVSSEAQAEGVYEGMSAHRARLLCPALHVLPPDPHLLARGNQALQRMGGDYTPVVEPGDGGRLFLDLTGCSRLLGPGRDVAARLEKDLRQRLRLSGNVGVAGNKLVARIAAGCLERPGVCDVLRGAEQSFIGPLPTTVLPGVGPTRQTGLLQDLNIRFVQELAALSVAQMRLVVGAFAPLLHQRARGIDPSAVRPPQKSPQVAEETLLARQDNDDLVLLAALCQLVEACGRRLRRLRRMTAEIVLCLTYADGVSHQRRTALDIPCNHDLELYTAAEDLLKRVCERRVRIKGMRLECRQLCPVISQVDLFTRSGPSPRQAALQQALDQVRDKYGMAAVRRGRTLPL